MDEIFLIDEETGLLVSNLGRVFGVRGWELKGRNNTVGYLRVSWRHPDGKQHDAYIHRLVARNFIPNPLNLPFINHKDENPANNRVDNLEWCSPKYNSNYGTLIERMKRTQIKHGHTRRCVLEKDGKLYSTQTLTDMAKLVKASIRAVDCVLRGIQSKVHGYHLPGAVPKQTGMQPIKTVITDGLKIMTFNSRLTCPKPIRHPHR